MKIYHKRSFAGGILCLLLAVGCGALLAAEGFQVKLLVSLALLLFLGGVDLVWAMSRESRMPRGDERDPADQREKRLVRLSGADQRLLDGVCRRAAALCRFPQRGVAGSGCDIVLRDFGGICHLAMYKRLLRKASVSMPLRQGGNEMDRAHDRNQIRAAASASG